MNEVEMLKDRIRDLEIERDEIRQQKIAAEFAVKVGRSLMVILTNVSYNSWPHLAKIAFEHEKGKDRFASMIYRSHLPE